MTAATREGVIKFQLDLVEGPAPAEKLLIELNAWRSVFKRNGLLGQDPGRYDGYSFGNLSRRLPESDGNAFVISGTQTGHLHVLRPEDYATVLACNPETNSLQATGQIKPSSEALSHGILYRFTPDIRWVMHLHSPDIFRERTRLNLPGTAADADYGTPAMAAEILVLAQSHNPKEPRLLVMTGHPDGILAYGPSAQATGELVIATLALARRSA
jgi:hypothetical protein